MEFQKEIREKTGWHHSKETCKKISESQLGKVISKETLEKLSEIRKHSPACQEHIHRLHEAKCGTHPSAETRKKLSIAKLGKRFSPEHCRNISEAIKNNLSNKAQLQKLNEARRGIPLSPETRKKISLAKSGNYPSDETRKKLSESHKNSVRAKEQLIRLHNMPVSNETRRLQSIAKRGISKSAAHCNNLCIARAKRVFPFGDTLIEKAMQNGLSRRGIPFIKHKCVIKPTKERGGHQCDLFIEPNIVIECDGDFWHAHPDKYAIDTIMYGGLSAGWIRNRDSKLTEDMISTGYIVIRFWEHEINDNIESCINKIEACWLAKQVKLTQSGYLSDLFSTVVVPQEIEFLIFASTGFSAL